jgi:hypothetical protein
MAISQWRLETSLMFTQNQVILSLLIYTSDFHDSLYLGADDWDCVATVFFIDTARNVIEYIETIYKILQPGGYWINLGPLLYHFSDMANESSIELPYDKLREVIVKFGFEIVVSPSLSFRDFSILSNFSDISRRRICTNQQHTHRIPNQC